LPLTRLIWSRCESVPFEGRSELAIGSADPRPWGRPRSVMRLITGADGNTVVMAKYLVNTAAVAHCRKLIDAHQYVVSSDWGDVQPSAEQQNDYLEAHSWTDFSLWHLGLTSDANEETKARYAFVYGDLRRVHRSGLIACVYRAAEFDHKEVELAAHDLLQHLDRTRA
jgi:hypothetical protein